MNHWCCSKPWCKLSATLHVARGVWQEDEAGLASASLAIMVYNKLMSPRSAKMSVLVGEKFACIRISGRANFSSSIDFKTLVHELRVRGFSCFVLDLSECVLMD